MTACPHCGFHPRGEACAGCGDRAAIVDGFLAYAPALAHGDRGYDPAYYRQLASLEAGNFWFRSRNRLILRLLSRHAQGARDYLEIGCGTGFVLEAVAARFGNWRFCGSEILANGLAFAAARVPRATLLQLDARQMPFDAAFDVIGAYDVIEHIDDDVRVLHGLHRALRPGGLAVLTVPQHRWLWSAQDRDAHHVRRYARGELEAKLRQAGFKIRWSGSYLALLLPLMALSRLRPERQTPHDPFAELRLPAWLDFVLDGVMRIEGGLIAAGVRFHFGGSRVVVARRPPSP